MTTVRSTRKDIDYKDDYRLYKCPYCSKTFTDNSSWYLHQSLHTSTELFRCDQCSYTTNIRKYLARHRLFHLPPTKYKCEVCGKGFRFRDKLDCHMRVHTGEKPFKCTECGKAFTANYSLQTHMYIHTNEKPFECSYCKYACRDHSTLKKHEERHAGIKRTYECNVCHKVYKTSWNLKEHIDEMHLGLNIRKHACERCDKAFTKRAVLIKHIQVVHEKSLRCECHVCGRVYTCKSNLLAHMKRHIDIKPYKCSFSGCKKRFVSQHDADRHVATHYPERQAACDVCGRRFARAHRLARHLATHARKRRRVQCDHCGQRFYSKLYLVTHIRRKHSRQRQTYICDLCGLVTHNKPSIVMHLKYGHAGEKETECSLCGAHFKRHQYLKLHLTRTHNIKVKSTLQRKYTKVRPIVIKEEPLDEKYTEEPVQETTLMEIQKQEIDDCIMKSEEDLKSIKSDTETSTDVQLQVPRDSNLSTPEHEPKTTDKLSIEYTQDHVEPLRDNIKIRRESNLEPLSRAAQPDGESNSDFNRDCGDLDLELTKIFGSPDEVWNEDLDLKVEQNLENETLQPDVIVNIENHNLIDQPFELSIDAAKQKHNLENSLEPMRDITISQSPTTENYKVERFNSPEDIKPISDEDIKLDQSSEPSNPGLDQDLKLIQIPMTVAQAKKPGRASILKPAKRRESQSYKNKLKPVKNTVRFVKRTVKSIPNPDLDLALDLALESVQILVPERDTSIQPAEDLEPIPDPVPPVIASPAKELETKPMQNRLKDKNHTLKPRKQQNIKRPRANSKPESNQNKIVASQFNVIEPPEGLDCDIIEIPMKSRIIEPNRDSRSAVRDPDSSDTVMEYSEGVFSEDISRSIALRHRRERGEPEHAFDKLFIDHAMEEPSKAVEPIPKEPTRDPGTDPRPGPEVTLEYSQRVLCEDISKSMTHRGRGAAGPESALDNLFIEHVLEKSENKEKGRNEMKKAKVNAEKVKQVNKIMNKMLNKARAHKEMAALEKARQQYNTRIQTATLAANKKEQVNIKYFQKKVSENSNKINDVNGDLNDKTDDGNGDENDKNDDGNKNDDENDQDSDDCSSDDNNDRADGTGKIKFRTHQCYICFKLFNTKTELTQHCQDHFDICSEIMLKKCPYCGYVTNRSIGTHLRKKHNVSLQINYGKMSERHNENGSKYMYEIEKDFVLEVIPSVKNLNRQASMKIDADKRTSKNKTLATRKLVRKGKEWVVETQELKVSNDYLLPEFGEKEYTALKIKGDSYEVNLKKLGLLAKKRGLKMLYPCQGCEKICQNLSALVLHKRKHEENPKAFKPKVWKARHVKKNRKNNSQSDKNTAGSSSIATMNRRNRKLKENRYAKPKPIVNKHKCDDDLIKFYENNIRGKDIEFWQFLKIYNKMSRENVNEFKDLESRTDFAFGIHVNDDDDRPITDQGADESTDKNILVTLNTEVPDDGEVSELGESSLHGDTSEEDVDEFTNDNIVVTLNTDPEIELDGAPNTAVHNKGDVCVTKKNKNGTKYHNSSKRIAALKKKERERRGHMKRELRKKIRNVK